MAENKGGDEIKELSESEAQCIISPTELLSGEITLRKRCIQKGHGIVRPTEDCVCSVRIENVSSEEGNHVIQKGDKKIHIGERDTHVDDAIDTCLRSMTEGEISTFMSVLLCKSTDLKNGGGTSKIKGTDTYESESEPHTPKTRPDPSIIDIKIELISIDKPGLQTWQLSPEEKLNKALGLKERGNSLYRSGDISLAFSRYRKAIMVLISMLPESNIPEDSLTDFTQARCHCYLNLAACQMKIKKWEYVIENCTKVLRIQPDNMKALYRRGQAYQQTKHFTAAKSDLQQCLKVEPKNKSVLTALQEISLKVSEKSDGSVDGHVKKN